jgi:ribonucleoside-triphosphate reductase
MEQSEFTASSTQKTLSSIKKTLQKSIIDKYGQEKEQHVDTLLHMHGLHKDNFDFIKMSEEMINSKINDVSIDDNANKNDKIIRGILKEVESPVDKAVGYDFLYKTMKELYGKQKAEQLEGELLDLSLGVSDSTNLLLPYCWALDASKIVLLGRHFGQLQSTPSKHLSSYISALNETVHELSSHLAGAIAIGTFFLDVAHVLIYNDKLSITDVQTTMKKHIENNFQNFVHSMNSLSRNAIESPFTNISIFDRDKLKTLLSQENYGWYFEETDESKSLVSNEHSSFIDNVVEYIMICQTIFIEFFDKGDPIKNGIPYRFPVTTINLSKKFINGEYKITDRKFFHYVCKRDIYRYNIFTSEGTKIASCCRLISSKEMLDLAAQSNSFGGTSISLGSHRVVTVNFNRIALECSSPLDYYRRLSKRIEDAGKILKSHKILLQKLTNGNLQKFIKLGWINLNRMFSTFGILGIYEAEKTLRSKFKYDKKYDIIETILKYFNKKMINVGQELELIVNCEQIPGESFAIRLCIADKLLFGDNNVPYQLYANQFVPLWEDASLWDKFDVDGKYNKLLTGGGIVHAQIGEKVTPKQAEQIIEYAVKSGCEHFALNGVYTEFEDGTTIFGRYENHPISGSNKKEWYTRIVGFFTPVSSWNKIRREWEFSRRTFVELPDKNI